MKLSHIASAAALLFCMTIARNALALDDDIFRVGVSARTFGDVNSNDAAAALKAWAAAVIKEQGLEPLYEVILITDPNKTLAQSVNDTQIDGLSCSVEDLIDLGQKPDYVYIPSSEGGYTETYVVVVQNDSRITSWKDIAGSRLIMGEGGHMVLALPWLKTMLQKNNQGQFKLDTLPDFPTENASKAILQTFFGKGDAALVTKDAFDIACELNPQLRQKLKILYQSQPLIQFLFVFMNSGKEHKHRKAIESWEKAIMELHKTPGGKQVLTVFKSTNMLKLPFSILEPTIDFILEYRRIVEHTTPVEAHP